MSLRSPLTPVYRLGDRLIDGARRAHGQGHLWQWLWRPVRLALLFSVAVAMGHGVALGVLFAGMAWAMPGVHPASIEGDPGSVLLGSLFVILALVASAALFALGHLLLVRLPRALAAKGALRPAVLTALGVPAAMLATGLPLAPAWIAGGLALWGLWSAGFIAAVRWVLVAALPIALALVTIWPERLPDLPRPLGLPPPGIEVAWPD